MTVAMVPGLMNVSGGLGRSKSSRRCIKLSPVVGVSYSEATLAFMKRARFETPRQAIYGMKDPNIEFMIEHVSA